MFSLKYIILSNNIKNRSTTLRAYRNKSMWSCGDKQIFIPVYPRIYRRYGIEGKDEGACTTKTKIRGETLAYYPQEGKSRGEP